MNTKIVYEKIIQYEESKINCTEHTFFRLSEKQRKLFTCDTIRKILLEQIPKTAGIQYNGCYALFYPNEKRTFIRIIADMKVDCIEIVTFYNIEESQVPRK